MGTPVIGIYGGTFDPVHLGHLAVAEEVCDVVGLSRLVFVPNRLQPLKLGGPHASPEDRLRMLEAALVGNGRFSVDALELQRDGPSYSIDTLDQLSLRWPEAQLRFVLGADAANGLPRWREPLRFLTTYRPIVMSRAGWPAIDWPALLALSNEARTIVQPVRVPDLAIASSDIRDRVANGRSIRYLVPDGVRDYIEVQQLYRDGPST